jgi:hypothetical protein
MWRPGIRSWWLLLGATLLIVALWPPADDRSLAVKFMNWAVDPGDVLPTLPGPLTRAESDDLSAVEAHDFQTRRYDELYQQGGWMRRRLDLKVARDPLNPATERQMLIAFGVLILFLAWRAGSHTT